MRPDEWGILFTRWSIADDDLLALPWQGKKHEASLWWGPMVTIEPGDIVVGFKTVDGFQVEHVAKQQEVR